MSLPPKPISNSISFALARVSGAHRSLASKILADVGLHVGQEMLLQFLWQKDKLTQSELANHLCIQLATTNKMIQRMERAGWVTKSEDKQDGRVSRVQLTQKGIDQQAATEEAWERLEQRTFANFSTKEQATIRRLLQQLYENLSKEE